ncbi:hypothetical protein FLP30_12990 (plasmid) [Acetobacter vaccinii]|uniref:Uncharacterized protein n=1 Tax=Acetobacter vaccinii TaxID=2592655 RepID=A0A5C1YUP4_9PROT|nr:hypothetical protein FLP30_12990 [Acetobacter vaccinii]
MEGTAPCDGERPVNRPTAEVFVPFGEGAQSVSLDGLTLENADDHVSLYGRLEIREDQVGLEAARLLKAQMEAIIAVLEARSDLPPVVSEGFKTHPVRNPFG